MTGANLGGVGIVVLCLFILFICFSALVGVKVTNRPPPGDADGLACVVFFGVCLFLGGIAWLVSSNERIDGETRYKNGSSSGWSHPNDYAPRPGRF